MIDSAAIAGGKFSLKGNMKSPEIVSLSIGESNYGLSIFLENSDIIIEADTAVSEHYDYTAYGAGKGGPAQKFYSNRLHQ